MKPEQFKEQAWKVVLHEATVEEGRWLHEQISRDEFGSACFERMQMDYQGLSATMQMLAMERSNPGGAEIIPTERLARLMEAVPGFETMRGAAESSAITSPIEDAKKVAANRPSPQRVPSGWAWLSGLAAALVLGFVKFMTHEAGHIAAQVAKQAEKGAAVALSHEAGAATKVAAREATEVEAREAAGRIAIGQALTEEKRFALRQLATKRAAAAATVAGVVSMSAAEGPAQAPGRGAGLRFEITADGVKILQVLPDGLAAAAGLRQGDVITEFEGFSISLLSEPVVKKLFNAPIEADFELGYRRGEEQRVVKISRVAAEHALPDSAAKPEGKK